MRVEMRADMGRRVGWWAAVSLLVVGTSAFYFAWRQRRNVQRLSQPLHRGELRIAGPALDRLAVRLLLDQPGVEAARARFWLRGQDLVGRVRVRPLPDWDTRELIPELERVLYRELGEMVGLQPRRLFIELVPRNETVSGGGIRE